MPLTEQKANTFFKLGIHAIEHDLSTAIGIPVKIHSLYLPDMRSLLRWSLKPALANDGIVLIAGSKEVISVLKDIMDPQYVILSENGSLLKELLHNLYTKSRPPPIDFKNYKQNIIFTTREIKYMCRFINGHSRQSESKRDSHIRRRVMAKIGAERLVSLVIKFRLLFYIDNHYLYKNVSIRKDGIFPPVNVKDTPEYFASLSEIMTERLRN